mmetsp:Transcript_38319/g.81200  ORF Transcript_38319/g.81200 Transcript_38319/m.81200 type:complete len:432 (-) Transcript_38319:288-1583(-)|eukprot:CAMPEP_0206455086 /NCGR_PEP_ID=MMETSP0324_2-20121206/21537_1 /ASSEMBLY_ACC=CAM_ASM_000836 /TAXON_ID=2866 /ORGANISM="Crypthecodinium cohnii, Strain Seligo" /LENGTH=431 /DNA_ID=CAMNT_0053925711 /DNA_START=220 /DNA_END=1515 /DNA_ORIENTATION=-
MAPATLTMRDDDFEAADGILRTPKGQPVALSPLLRSSTCTSTSTAASTLLPPAPQLSLLPLSAFDDHLPAFKRSTSGSSTPVQCRFQRTFSGCSTNLPEDSADHHASFLHDSSFDGKAAQHQKLGASYTPTEVVCPNLMSELARWAEAVVMAEEWMESELEIGCSGSKSNDFRGERHEYFVDNSGLCADTIGLALRNSKNPWDRDHEIPGPKWGSYIAGYDEGDGWVRVGEHYLPEELLGATVLLQRSEALKDGPALTIDGRVLELSNGGIMHFSCDQGAQQREAAKAHFRMMRSLRFAHAACEAEAAVDNDDCCALDAAGVLHCGFVPPPTSLGRSPAALIRLHRRQQQKKRLQHENHRHHECFEEGEVLCVGGDGRVLVVLAVENEEHRNRLNWKRQRLWEESQQPSPRGEVLAEDQDGTAYLLSDIAM